MSNQHHVKHETRHLAKEERGLRERLRQEKSLSYRDEWLLEGSSHKDQRPIEVRPASAYRPPSFLAKTTSPEEAEVLHRLLLRVKSANDEAEGEYPREVKVLLNASLEVEEIGSELRRWSERYVSHRIAKGNFRRDKGNPVATYRRLAAELLPWLDELCFGDPTLRRVDSIHSLFLAEMTEYIPWLIYKATWAKFLRATWTEDGYRLAMAWDEPRERAYCFETAKFRYWAPEDSLRRFMAEFVRAERSADPSATRERLRLLAEGIGEMRPFLVRGFKQERSVFKVQEGLWVCWTWVLRQQHLALGFASSERKLLEGIRRFEYDLALGVGVDGLLCNQHLAWQSVATEELPDHAWAVNLEIVEAIHDRMFASFQKVDVDAILASWKPTDEPDNDSRAAEDEVFAATLWKLAEVEPGDDEAETGEDEEPQSAASRSSRSGPRGRRNSLRSQQLFSLLRGIGCEVRSGKGSEISVFRPGGRIYTLGRHKRNDRVAWHTIRGLLKRVGISLEEWLSAIN